QVAEVDRHQPPAKFPEIKTGPFESKIDLLHHRVGGRHHDRIAPPDGGVIAGRFEDRKSTRLNSSHGSISYAVFCLKKKKYYSSWGYCQSCRYAYRRRKSSAPTSVAVSQCPTQSPASATTSDQRSVCGSSMQTGTLS